MLVVVLTLARDIPKMPREHEAPVVGDTLELHSVAVLDDLPICMACGSVPLHLEDLLTSLINDLPRATVFISKSSEGIVMAEQPRMVFLWLIRSVPCVVLQEGIEVGGILEVLNSSSLASLMPDVDGVGVALRRLAVTGLELVVELLESRMAK